MNQPGDKFKECAELLRREKYEERGKDAIQEILDARADDYGYFADNANFAQRIKEVYATSDNWMRMAPHQREALDFIASKIGRLLSGNPSKIDSWDDIAGYAQLVATNLRGEKR